MFNFIREHKILVISLGLVFGSLFYLAQQSPGEVNSVNTDTFRTVDLLNPMSRGDKDAKVSIIQYSDFICPSCSYFSTQIMPIIDKNYIQTGKVKFEFRPMAFIADGSTQSGMGAYCAIDQKKFWPYHDAIYAYVAQKELIERVDPKTAVVLTADIVKDLAKNAGLESASFGTCIDSKTNLSKITDATNLANSNGVKGTPYIMINGQVYDGNMTMESFDALIKANL